ncbi:MAG: type II toxin-antitoxin system HicA family toxin [Rhodocyclaceae bacterium]|nr:type II toxin-antitoxin system HicA family toxin [Rhodocyclaceae bacterium]
MSHKHAAMLRTLFRDPISANIHWRDIESLLRHLGASVEPAHGARFRILLNGREGFFHMPHHGNACNPQSIRELRDYLAHAGVSPARYEMDDEQRRAGED